MDLIDELVVPSAAEDEARAPSIVKKVANTIGALAAAGGALSPKRFEKALLAADAVSKLLGEPSLTRLLTLRALSSPQSPRDAIAALKSATTHLSGPERTELMRELAPLIGSDQRPVIQGLARDLASALSVPLPDHLRNDSGILEAIGFFADRAKAIVHSEAPLVAAARGFAIDFGDAELLDSVANARQTGDQSILQRVLIAALDAVRAQISALTRASQAQEETNSLAQELAIAAHEIERVARQRDAAITRRASMLKRHIRDDLNALVEDAAEEFEADFRRQAERKKGWFSKLDTTDLNERMVVKNIERRYRILAQRYQDELDLLDREVSEFCEEFTRITDEALRPIARHEFRRVAPQPSLELRAKAVVDRASTRTLVGGAAGAAVSSAAIHAGLLTTGAIVAAAATPAGAVVLGAVTVAGIWKMCGGSGFLDRSIS